MRELDSFAVDVVMKKNETGVPSAFFRLEDKDDDDDDDDDDDEDDDSFQRVMLS
jgi:hypothetical protein